jgi:hypothetical protein
VVVERLDEEPVGESIVPVPEIQNHAIAREPQEVLDEAMKAAKLLKSVIDQKARPVRFNNETYLEFEDWQTVGRFYGATARVIANSTQYVQYGEVVGFQASAEVIDQRTGNVLSVAEAMCLSDEPNWSKKPLFQIRSMAQTRACAKAFRNVFSWVVVLAGYRPTPAEEMEGVFPEKHGPRVPSSPDVSAAADAISQGTRTPTVVSPTGSNVTEVRFIKAGETNGKPWKIHVVTLNGSPYTVFDEGLVDTLTKAMKAGVEVKILATRPGRKAGDIVLDRIDCPFIRGD